MATKKEATKTVKAVNQRVREAAERLSKRRNELDLAIGRYAELKRADASALDVEIAKNECFKMLDLANEASSEFFYINASYADEPLMSYLRDPYIEKWGLKETSDPYFGDCLVVTSSKVKSSLGELDRIMTAEGKKLTTSTRWRQSFGTVVASLIARKISLLGDASFTGLSDALKTRVEEFLRDDEARTYKFAANALKTTVASFLGEEAAETVGEDYIEYLNSGLVKFDKKFGWLKASDPKRLADELTAVLIKATGIDPVFHIN